MSDLSRSDFIARFGSVFEHSPWVAEDAFDRGVGPGAGTAEGLHAAMVSAFRAGDDAKRLAVLNAHPDLAGRLARAGRLTADSTSEQAGAGLDSLTDAERAIFTQRNDAYKAKFAFPFIMAVKGRRKPEILQAFETRLRNDVAQERVTAEREVETIALLRLRDMLP